MVHIVRVFTDKPEQLHFKDEAINLWFRIDLEPTKNYS